MRVCIALAFVYYAQMLSLDISARAGQATGILLAAAWLGLGAAHGAVFAAALSAGALLKCPGGLRALLFAVLGTARNGCSARVCWAFRSCASGSPNGGFAAYPVGAAVWRPFISFLIVFVNVLLAQAALGTGKGRLRYLAAAVLVFLANLAGGMFALGSGTEEPDTGIAAVQMNVPFWQNGGKEGLKSVGAGGRSGRREAGPHHPAGKFGVRVLCRRNRGQRPGRKAGTRLRSLRADRRLRHPRLSAQNSVFLTAPDGEIADVYHKQRLVPFFENGYERKFSFADGKERGIFETAYGAVGVMICFESLFPDIASQTAAGGAELLVVATNDSWFKSDVPLARHLAQSVLRAQETGRWLVQAEIRG